MVRNVGREDVLWDRPVFKAPPLEPKLPHLRNPPFTDGLHRLGLPSR